MRRKLLVTMACGLLCLNARGETPPPLVIMPLGDSITAGYHTGKGGYRNFLRDILLKNGVKVDFAGRSTDRSDGIPDPEHEGYSGATIQQITDKANEALQTLKPDIILLFAGSNDIRVNGDNGNPANPIYWKTAPVRFENLLETIWKQSPRSAVIVGTLMPFGKTWAVRENAAKEFNANLIKMVARFQAEGKKIQLADFRKTVKTQDLSDGLHPNEAGYKKMAKVWAGAITKVQKMPKLTETGSK